MPRPKIELDINEIETLAGQGLTQREICYCLGISQDTLNRRKKSSDFAEAIARGQARSHQRVANALFEKAIAGDLGAIIWYEKTRCGLTDRQNITHQVEAPSITVEGYHYEQAIAALAPTEDES